MENLAITAGITEKSAKERIYRAGFTEREH